MCALGHATIKRNVLVLFAAACLAASVPATRASAAAPVGAYTTAGAYSYVSAPKLHPPKIATDAPTVASKLARGDFLISIFKNFGFGKPMVGQGGPLLLDRNLSPIWYDPVPLNVYSLNFRTQTFDGKPALSWWEGVITNTGAVTSGKDFVVDQHYRQVATLTGQDGWTISPHELVITGGDDAWVTAYKDINVDLTPYGGNANGILTDAAVQEYALKTTGSVKAGQLLFSWDAFNPGGTPNVPLSQSKTSPTTIAGPWDAYHVNSIQLPGHGQFLVSFRNTWAAYLVNINNGSIAWTLGGKSSSFAFGAHAAFEWQHDVELQPGGKLSLFDDACCGLIGPGKVGPPMGPSRGIVLSLSMATHVATLARQYLETSSQSPHGGLDTSTQGNTDQLANGNIVVGWGGAPYFSEYSAAGKLLFDARLPDPDTSYRAYVSPWVGTPLFPPSVAVKTIKGKTTVYASWDGATEVANWTVLAGTNANHLRVVAKSAKHGFETAITVSKQYTVYKVQARDAKGHVLGISGVFPKPKSIGTGGFY